LDDLVDSVLSLLEELKVKITFFVVGQDAEFARNAKALAAIAAAGHEIGNHSFHHEPWLHLRSRTELNEEIGRAERAIEKATGQRPRGFRGPGFSLSAQTLEVLAERGYLYDASTLPTFIGPLARAYYFRRGQNLSTAERKQRDRLFGTLSEGLRPLKPYTWNAGGRDLIEIPVTTVPIVRLPFHLSYLLYIATFSRSLALAYLRTAIVLCRGTGVNPSFLLHPLDFLGGDKVRELAFFPGMSLSTAFKQELFRDVMALLTQHFKPVPMEEHAEFVRRMQPEGVPASGRQYAG
jgi:peptidoglycan/xylan/chitin deacetylase (PgdA/CDA1 family)